MIRNLTAHPPLTQRAPGAHSGVMQLDTHMRSKGLTDEQFAKMIGCSRPFVTRLRNADTNASFTTLQRIERATAGQVTAVDLYEARKARVAAKAPTRSKKRRAALHAAE